MRARIRATGEILEILDIGVSGKYFYLSNDKKYSRNELEFLSETIDWQQVHIQAAIAAMQGMVISDAYCSEEPVGPAYQIKRRKWSPERIAKEAVAYADFLIAELQKKGGEDENNH